MSGERKHETAAEAGVEAGDAPLVILDPQRLLRIASVTREVLEEARRITPKPEAVDHLRRVHGQICHELSHALPPKLYEELSQLTPDVSDDSMEELALAHAEILGWLEGLFQGAQLALQAQAAAANQGSRPEPPPQEEPTESNVNDPRYL